MVADFKLFGSKDEHAQLMTCVDAGIVSENINLYCESVGLATITCYNGRRRTKKTIEID